MKSEANEPTTPITSLIPEAKVAVTTVTTNQTGVTERRSVSESRWMGWRVLRVISIKNPSKAPRPDKRYKFNDFTKLAPHVNDIN